jgi:hypothetical protein
MMKRVAWLALLLTVVSVGIAGAQYAVLDMVAQKVVERYQQSTCEQLWQQRSQPKSQREQEILQMLRNDPQMRADFINRIAAPVANKMFECGLIP